MTLFLGTQQDQFLLLMDRHHLQTKFQYWGVFYQYFAVECRLDWGGARVYTSSALRRGHGSRAGRRAGAAPLSASWLLWSFVHVIKGEKTRECLTCKLITMFTEMLGENVSSVLVSMKWSNSMSGEFGRILMSTYLLILGQFYFEFYRQQQCNNETNVCSCLRFIFQL